MEKIDEVQEKFIEEKIDEIIKETYNEEDNVKTMKITFTIVTLVLITVAHLLYFFPFKYSDFFFQLAVGAAASCFVVSLQEHAKDARIKSIKKAKQKMKEKVLEEIDKKQKKQK